jgi:hypothetical protein
MPPKKMPDDKRTASISIRTTTEIKKIAEELAARDSRTLASWIEILLIDHLKQGGHLK